MWGYHETMTWWWMIPMAAFWISVVLLVIWGTRVFSGGQLERAPAIETPLEIAQARLARGEISAQEFDDLRNRLSPVQP